MSSWFLFLDRDLDVIPGGGYYLGLDLTGVSIGPSTNMFVTDVTSMEGISASGLGTFAYVGLGGNASDPTPTTITTLIQKRMCAGYISSGGVGFGKTYDLTDPLYSLPANEENNTYFPNRIVELPLGATDGGFMICGVGANDPINSNNGTTFFLRTDYAFETPAAPGGNNDIELYSSTDLDEGLYASDLYFDNVKSEVWFAGIGFGTNDGNLSFIYQKLWDFTTPGVHIYPTMDLSNNATQPAFGKMYPWYQAGILDVAKIMPTDNGGGCCFKFLRM